MPKGVYEHKRKYPKTNDHCVYAHSVFGLDYFGSTGDDLCKRWNPSDYKTTVLQPFIKMVGWDNIEHRVIKDGLTPDEAIELENILIKTGWQYCTCINRQLAKGSKQYFKQYREEHKEEFKQYFKQYREEHKEKIKQYNKKQRSTPARKIYIRVYKYNRNHTPIEAPLEAKNKYLEYGYIPNYIKCDDLL